VLNQKEWLGSRRQAAQYNPIAGCGKKVSLALFIFQRQQRGNIEFR
jgi:hypothetical protein